MKREEFLELIWQKGDELYREMPWRTDTRPYYVLVSELMLQQTQVDRVIPKFEAFIKRFPDERHLADAPLAEVLTLWNGLGYNRRAKFLHESARKIVYEYQGIFPSEYDQVLDLPGVGKGTAGALMTYAFNTAQPFVETNVRTVYFQHFFEGYDTVDDKEILAKVVETIDHEHPRAFYWALMDYGSWLKRHGASRNALSRGYKKQSPLKGSVREVRGQIIRQLTETSMTEMQLKRQLSADERFEPALLGLLRDGLVTRTNGRIHLTK
ncbi:MAG TPA: hypothetical protein VJ841_03070 [Candidatus Saccharimonadales bacterium]|nr:hypothetical protein [Candidatus Saccharimonadales bacterium]